MRRLGNQDTIRQARVIGQIAALAALVDSGQSPLSAMERVSASARGAGQSRGDETMLLLADRFDAALRAESLGLDGAALLSPGGGARRGLVATEAPDWLEQILRDLASCQRLSARCGIPLGRLLAYAVDCAHARQDANEAIRTAMAVPESTARLLLALPFIGAGFGMLLLGEAWLDAAVSAPGACAIGGAAGLVLLGRVWTARILNRARTTEIAW